MVCSAYSYLHVAKLYFIQVVTLILVFLALRFGDDAMGSAISMTGV